MAQGTGTPANDARDNTSRADQKPGKENIENTDNKHIIFMMTMLGAVSIAGLVAVLLNALRYSPLDSFFANGIGGTLVGGASAVSGGLLGLLFGIPRAMQRDEPSNTDYVANTNLEQISDWLTKILVGVGLTQISNVPEALGRLGSALSSVFGGESNSGSSIAVAVVLYFLLCGFLIGFLWARVYLLGVLRWSDVQGIAQGLRDAQERSQEALDAVANSTMDIRRELDEQAQRDAMALSLLSRQLNPSADHPPVTQDQLTEALRAASPAVKVTAFDRAHSHRQQYRDADKRVMARSIPIFRALVADDAEGQFHRNHAELGYALRDLEVPDFTGAEAELSKAIEIRNKNGEQGWTLYEFIRTLCRIDQDPAFKAGKASSPELQQMIIQDLQAAVRSPLRERVLQNQAIIKWMDQNQVTESQLV